MNDVHVMIDIETLCNDSSGGVILEIGACAFDFTSPSPRLVVTEGGQFGTFRKIIDIESSLEAGLKIEASTLRWWLEEEDGKQKRFCDLIKNKTNDYVETLIDFRSWLGVMCNYGWKKLQVWSHGATYDLSILDNHYKAGPFVGGTPWPFRNQNDTRTLIRLYSEIFGVEPPKEENPYLHNSLADACFQARQMQHIVRRFKNVKALAMRSLDYEGGVHNG